MSGYKQGGSGKTYGGEPPGRTLNVARFGQLDVRRAVPEPIDPQAGQRDQEFLLVAVGQVDREDRVPDLLDDDTTTYTLTSRECITPH